jgi:hypothetical protein
MFRPVVILSVPAILFLSGTAGTYAAEPSGTVVAVVQSADVEAGSGRRLLAVSAPVFSGDRVRTGAVGEAQLRFRDDTKMVVGANSSLLIDKFVYDPDASKRRISINAIKGAFRFISGSSPKSAYSIRTPTATIGIRGTRFDLSVTNGVTTFALFEGGARVCNRSGQCAELRGSCSVAVIPGGKAIRQVPGGVERSQILAAKFPYVRSQSRLLPDFRANTSSCSITRAQNNSGKGISTASIGGDTGGDNGGGDGGGSDGGGGDGSGDGGGSSSSGNHSGLGDGSNPGQGAAHSNSGNTGTGNPGGSK